MVEILFIFLSLALFIATPSPITALSVLSLFLPPKRGKMVQTSRAETFKCISAM
jgi:hypothetical protein